MLLAVIVSISVSIYLFAYVFTLSGKLNRTEIMLIDLLHSRQDDKKEILDELHDRMNYLEEMIDSSMYDDLEEEVVERKVIKKEENVKTRTAENLLAIKNAEKINVEYCVNKILDEVNHLNLKATKDPENLDYYKKRITELKEELSALIGKKEGENNALDNKDVEKI